MKSGDGFFLRAAADLVRAAFWGATAFMSCGTLVFVFYKIFIAKPTW